MPIDGELKPVVRRGRWRTAGVFALGMLCGFVVTALLVALTGGEIHTPSDRDEKTAQKREALMQALETAARQQPLLSDVEVLITPYGSGHVHLQATVKDDATIDDLVAVYSGIASAASTEMRAAMYAGIPRSFDFQWTVNGANLSTEVSSSEGLRPALTIAYAAVETGAPGATVNDGVVTVNWGERGAEGLTALRPGADRDPGVGTMTYVQEAEVGGMQVKIWVPAGAAHLDNLDLSNLISAAQKAGFKEVYLGAGGYRRELLFRLPIENADKEGMTEAARSLLPELDVCDTDGVVELTAELLSGDLDAVTLSYVCKNGEMQVDTSAEDDYGTPHPDPQLAAELLEETRQ